ncbi:MAG: PorV/PorQ family protein [Ignavibacteriales bacterium]|nr:PorV/PorQ family protein [Ignavibacteriales bacterium]
MKKIILLLLIAVPLAAQQFGQVGTSGAQLFKINFDPRASGLGNAATSVVNNAAAVYTNVAGLEGVQKGDIAFTYSPWFAGIDMVSIAAAYRLENIGVIGVQATGFSTNEEITTIEMENGTGQTYSIQNVVLGLSFARHITEKLVIGAQAKYIRESYFDHSTSGFAFDLGSNYDLGFSGAHLAMTLQNFGPDLDPLAGSYNDYSDGNNQKGFLRTPLPVTFRASFTLEPIVADAYRVRVIADLIHPNDNVEHYCIGSEVVLFNLVALRGGLKLNYDDERFAFGVGIKGSQLLGQDVRFDYSYEQFKTLPSIQKLSLGIGF